MKAIVGVAGGATRAAMTQHHAVRGNMADVAAKDAAQETAVNLVASFAALLIISLFGNHLLIFVLMMVLHIVFNYLAVRAVCLRTLNEPRFLQVIDTYLRKEVIAAPCEVNRKEPIIFYQLGPSLLDLKLCGFQIKLGCSLKDFTKNKPFASYLNKLRKIYDERKYILNPMIGNRQVHILIKEDAVSDDMLCAYFHAVLLAVFTCAINDDVMPLYNEATERPFAQVCRAVQAAEWSREPAKTVHGSCTGYNYEPSYELMRYLDKIVQNEWYRVKAGLEHTGWDLNKNLLIVDEWRICSTVLQPNPISMEALEIGSKVSPFGQRQMAMPVDEMNKRTFLIEPDD